MSEKYEFSELEKYYVIRRNRDDIAYDGYCNNVYFNTAEKTINIQVSSYYESGDEEQEADKQRATEEWDVEPDLPFDDKIIMDCGNDYLYRDVFHLSCPSDNIPSFKINPFAGLDISFPIGEGILDFCYTDFNKEKDSLELMGLINQAFAAEKAMPVFHNSDEIDVYESGKMENAISMLEPFMYQSVYSSIFPPLIENLGERTLLFYAAYINKIQQEMLRRIEFVFDDEFYPEELSPLTAHERYGLYSKIYETPRRFERKERFDISSQMDKMTLECSRLPTDVIIGRLQSYTDAPEKSLLEQALDLKAGTVSVSRSVPLFMSKAYICSTIHEMLELEFSKMLEYGIRLHKCKNCGRYFIVKGNYDAEYCDRIREGQTKNCQQIAAQKRYDEKLHGNEAVALFRKYYKRYYSRTRVGTIKADKFKQWNYAACEMRDRCLNGEISVEKFEMWLEGSFRNRVKK